ncbi:transglycosylase SLT domain-containing protein [Candidatus Parcubacteria bacterium]|nr:transglycosylase SLT domain-containing protein [Candidatus Parcubacteria bacterium]
MLATKINAAFKLIVSGTILGTSLLAPALPVSPVTTPLTDVTNSVVKAEVAIVDSFFGNVSVDVSDAIIGKQMDFVSTRPAYAASLDVIERHADTIKAVAAKKGVPEDVAIGVAFLENGGSETAKSSAGALGVYQLMPGTARNLGLTVNKKQDDRKDPEKSITAGITYLAENYERFGDWGLATWAYHAGEGNVTKALQIYAKANDGITLPGVSDSATLRAYVESHNVTIHKLLSDASVEKFTKRLHDDSAGYPYKVVATATLFRQAGS